ncbi:MAG: hypothetical protein HZB30_08110 [Nitrospirae bacterium]|nr:hypothetical protein [Nitrospirota bacterium]
MNKHNIGQSLKDIKAGLSVAVLIGLTGYFLTNILHSPLLDPLIVALILGIAVKSSIGDNKKIEPGIIVASSIAMSAIGLNADVRELFSNNGAKALIMAFAGFLAATFTFVAGLYIVS